MTHDVDRALKQRILSERVPNMPKDFEAQTVGLLVQAAQVQPALAQGRMLDFGDALRARWVTALVLVLALSLAWKWGVDQLTEDDELLRVDTLSMSSLLVL